MTEDDFATFRAAMNAWCREFERHRTQQGRMRAILLALIGHKVLRKHLGVT